MIRLQLPYISSPRFEVAAQRAFDLPQALRAGRNLFLKGAEFYSCRNW